MLIKILTFFIRSKQLNWNRLYSLGHWAHRCNSVLRVLSVITVFVDAFFVIILSYKDFILFAIFIVKTRLTFLTCSDCEQELFDKWLTFLLFLKSKRDLCKFSKGCRKRFQVFIVGETHFGVWFRTRRENWRVCLLVSEQAKDKRLECLYVRRN